MVDKLYSALNRTLDIACPKTKQKVVDKNNPCWTNKHHEARKQISKLYRKKQRKPSETNITAYKKTEYAKLCRNSQDKDWNIFKSKPEDIKETNNLRKIFEGLCITTIRAFEKPNGTEPGLHTLNFLLKSHCPTGEEIKEKPNNYEKQILNQKSRILR